MKYNRKGDATGGDVPPSIRLDIREEHRGGGGSTSFFEPRRERTPGSSGRSGGRDPPEKRLTLLALRLAVLEKAASGLGKLDFVWATVVLLGGFASSLRITDFWCVTVILLGEGARVFSRSHELEWQHHAAPQTDAGALRSSSRFLRRIAPAAASPDGFARFQRTWNTAEVSLLPYTGWVFVSRKAGRVLNWLQVVSALACVALSSMRLWKHDFGAGDARNKRPALLLFYTLALLEASLFLLEKAYWAWKLSVRRLLHQVSAECGLGGAHGPAALTRFFYDSYSRCIAGSVFDGIKMDLVAFAEDLVLSDFLDEQLIGARILQQLASNNSHDDTLREVGASPRAIERLVEMLNWKRPDEEEVRRCAAEVVSRLAGRRQNALRVSAIPGAIESVMSLLHTNEQAGTSGYDHLPFNLLGLLILKRLARDHDNCGKMGSTRGLLAKIIDFTRAPPALLRNPHAAESQMRAVKRALQLVKMLASATGSTGRALRHEIAENVFSVSHLRGILRNGQGQRQHRELQKLAIDVLTGLAVEETGKNAIVSTGGTVKLLLTVFDDEDSRELGSEASEALATLALESETACAAILKGTTPDDDVIGRILPALQVDGGDPRRLNGTRLLRNLCAYSGPEHRDLLRAAAEALPAALSATMAPEESDKVVEASIGLTAEICGLFFLDGGERFGAELRGAGFDERAYVERLATLLRRYTYPEMRVPRMRRFVVQQLIWLMTTGSSAGYVELLREAGMERQLESVADTTSALESYHVFSGSVGIGKHCDNFSNMVDTATELLAARGGSRPQD